jgi:hypothetical protein
MPLDTPQAAVLAASPGPLLACTVDPPPAPEARRSFTKSASLVASHCDNALSRGNLECKLGNSSAQQALHSWRQQAFSNLVRHASHQYYCAIVLNSQSHTLGCYKLTLGYRNKTFL